MKRGELDAAVEKAKAQGAAIAENATIGGTGGDDSGGGDAAVKLDGEEEEECRDSGFTRPRVLILTPFKSTAMTFVRWLLDFLGITVCVRVCV